MTYTAIIEIPKGSDRRTHMAYDKNGFIDLGPIKDQIPVNNGVCPVNYGFIEGTFNSDDGDEVDVMVFSKHIYKTGDTTKIEVAGMLRREDGDNKIIAFDDSEIDFSFAKLLETEKNIVLSYMGYKSKIISIEGKKEAIDYVQKSLK